MKAILRERYGSLRLAEVEKPSVPDDGVLVRVRASSLNAVDWYDVMGRPYFSRLMGSGVFKPKDARVGSDFAGTVEAVGSSVTRYRPGDEVFGTTGGSYAEYVCVSEDAALATKPAGVPFDQAGGVGVAAFTALQALRDKGRLEAGQKVLVNGASGGVGTFAVQIAKAMGAEVTAVCSTGNVELARSLGADRVVDYTREDFTRSDERYDLMLDVAGSRSWAKCKRVLADEATFLLIGGDKSNRVIGPVGHMAGVMLASWRSRQKAAFFVAKPNHADLAALAELMEAGTVRTAIDTQYELAQLPEAAAYFGEGHARAKVVITVPA